METFALLVARFAFDLVLKATLILGASAIALLLLRRASSALRHHVATLGLAAAALLPVFALVVPRVDLPVLPPEPARQQQVVERFVAPAALPDVAGTHAEPLVSPARPSPTPTPSLSLAPSPSLSPTPSPSLSLTPSPSLSLPPTQPPSFLSSLRARTPLLGLWVALALASLWACGALLLLARLGLGVLRAERMITTAATAPAPSFADALSRAMATLGLRRDVRLLVSAGARVAMTAGSAEPVVVLPGDSQEWSIERQRVVLLHELAHVRRGDWLSLLLAEASLAIWWFHPLAWRLAAAARREAEQAADDVVLASGLRPSDYAAHLVALVRGMTPIPDEVLAMAMARSSAIEARLLAILDPSRLRRAPGSVWGRVLTFVLLGGAGALAALQPTAAATASEAESLVEDDAETASDRAQEARDRAEEARDRAEEARDRAQEARDRAQEQLDAAAERDQALEERAQEFDGRSTELEQAAQDAAQQALASLDAAGGVHVDAEAFSRRTRESVREAMRQAREELRRSLGQLKQQSKSQAWNGAALDRVRARMAELPEPPEAPFPPMPPMPPRPPRAPHGGVWFDGDGLHLSGNFPFGAHHGSEWYDRGLSRHHAGRYAQAIEAFQRSYDAGEREADSAYNIACGYARLGDKAKAVEWLRRAADEGFDISNSVEEDDDLESLAGDAGWLALKKELGTGEGRRKAQAQALVRKFARLEDKKPKDPSRWSELGHELLRAGDYERSAKAFAGAAERSEEKVNALYNQACALALKGDKRAALDALDRAIQEGFSDLRQLRRDGDLDDVRTESRFAELTQLAKDLRLDGDGSWMGRLGSWSWNWSWSGRRSGDEAGKRQWKEELPRLEKAAKDHSKIGRAHWNLGYARLAAGDAKGAEESFQKALDLGYRKGAVLYNLACAAARQGQTDKALERLGQALDAGFSNLGLLASDDDLESLRDDPRFRKLLRRAEELADAE